MKIFLHPPSASPAHAQAWEPGFLPNPRRDVCHQCVLCPQLPNDPGTSDHLQPHLSPGPASPTRTLAPASPRFLTPAERDAAPFVSQEQAAALKNNKIFFFLNLSVEINHRNHLSRANKFEQTEHTCVLRPWAGSRASNHLCPVTAPTLATPVLTFVTVAEFFLFWNFMYRDSHGVSPLWSPALLSRHRSERFSRAVARNWSAFFLCAV